MAPERKIQQSESFRDIFIFQPDYGNDISGLFPDSGKRDIMIRDLNKKLQILQDRKLECLGLSAFEPLTGTKGCYSLKLKGEVNLRLIFVFRQHAGRLIVIIVYAFAEKDKRKKNSSYADAKKVVNKRLVWIEQEGIFDE